MTQLSRLTAILLLVSTTAATAQNQTTSPNLYSNSASQVIGPTILPEAPGTINGGNPFQGLGRPDDTGPLRANPIQQYTPGNNTNGLFSTGSSFPSTPSVEQPGFGGQSGFSSNNTSSDPGTVTPANAALIQNLNPLPQSLPGNEPIGDTTSDTRPSQINSQPAKSKADNEDGTTSENPLSIDKLLTKSHQNRAKTARLGTTREANQLAMALKEMNGGNYTKCLETLDSIIKNEPKNAQAYYVKAVTNVLMRDFAHARQNYEMTLRCTSDELLIAKTKAGLLKLGR